MKRPATAVATALVVIALAPAAGAGDWPGWRGPERDGRSADSGLLDAWPAEGPPLVYRVEGLGEGYSSLAIARGVLVTLGAASGEEQVVALSADTGARLWSVPHGPVFHNDRGDGPRGTPVIAGDHVFALTSNGRLSALELKSGRLLWSLDILERFGGRNIQWGLSESPLVVGERVLVSPGGRGAGIVALDAKTGRLLWQSQSDAPGYSSGVLAQVQGKTQAVFFTDARALGLDLDDGSLLWEYDQVANGTANVATPIVRGNRVFLSSDYGTGCALLELGPRSARAIYFNRDMRNHHSSSVLVGDHLYGFSGSILTAMELDTGRVAWSDRSVGKGSLIYADSHLYLLSERGVVGLAQATPEGYLEKGRFELPRRSQTPTWSHPAIADGRLYVRDQRTLYVYDLRRRE